MKSKQWEKICKERINNFDISNFKRELPGFAFTNFNPHVNGMRYLKAFTYFIAEQLFNNSTTIDFINRIKNRDVGNPISVDVNGINVDMDYIQAVYECITITDKFFLNNRSIIEIGAGYGRTCHAILSNYDIKHYTIVDLPEVLNISHKYLKNVLDPILFNKIAFYEKPCFKHDFMININGFSEMIPADVIYYLDYAKNNCGVLYVKGPVAYYEDPTICTPKMPNKSLLKEVINDIHDENIIEDVAESFIETYCPKKATVIHDGWAKPWSYFWEVIYKL